jgi:hypothetical protein
MVWYSVGMWIILGGLYGLGGLYDRWGWGKNLSLEI